MSFSLPMVAVASALLTWVMLLTASTLRSRSYTPAGFVLALGNRDDLPEPSPVAGRADRAARNMLENLLLFVTVLVAAKLQGASDLELLPWARLFLVARVAYFGVYLAGIRYLRTAVWAVGVAALVPIALAAL
jgi:uncharacterized MAPEG superfamily protein